MSLIPISIDADKFKWEINPFYSYGYTIVDFDIVGFGNDSYGMKRETIGRVADEFKDFKPLELPELPKLKLGQGLYYQMQNGKWVSYDKDKFSLKSLRDRYTQTELKSNEFMNMLERTKPYYINAKGSHTVQTSK